MHDVAMATDLQSLLRYRTRGLAIDTDPLVNVPGLRPIASTVVLRGLGDLVSRGISTSIKVTSRYDDSYLSYNPTY